jgi:hypothetical protein
VRRSRVNGWQHRGQAPRMRPARSAFRAGPGRGSSRRKGFWVGADHGAERLGEGGEGDVAVPAEVGAAFEVAQAEPRFSARGSRARSARGSWPGGRVLRRGCPRGGWTASSRRARRLRVAIRPGESPRTIVLPSGLAEWPCRAARGRGRTPWHLGERSIGRIRRTRAAPGPIAPAAFHQGLPQLPARPGVQCDRPPALNCGASCGTGRNEN